MTSSGLLALALGTVGAALCVAVASSCGTSEAPPSVEDDAEVALDAKKPPKPPVSYGDSEPKPPVDAAIDYDADPWDGQVPFPGEWRAIPGMPASCGARIAVDPKVSVSRFPWKACPSGREECKFFVADWAPVDTFTFAPYPVLPVFEDANGVHISYFRAFRKDPPYRVSVLQRLDGDAELAIYGDSSERYCGVAQLSASPDGVGLVVAQALGTIESFIAEAPLSDPGNFTVTRITPKLGTSPLIQGMARGNGFVGLEQTSVGLSIYASAYRFGDQTVVPSTAPVDSERPKPSTGGYFALVAGSPSYAAFMPIEGGYRPVVRPLPGNRVVHLGVDHASAEALVWIEEGNSGATLFTSPFATTEAALQRRAVAKLPTSKSGVVNAGVFVAPNDYASIRMVRLSDGLGWDVAAEPGLPMMGGTWVNADYVWARISMNQPGAPGFPVEGGILRVKRAPLGAPTVPTGL